MDDLKELPEFRTVSEMLASDFNLSERTPPLSEPIRTTSQPDNRHSPYLTSALFSMHMIVEDALRELSGVQFEAFVCTGVSGLLVAPLLAHRMGKRLAIVRKPEDKDNHAETRVESSMKVGDRWIFIDDLVASGNTIRRVQERMECAGWPPMMGHYTYNSPHYTPGAW